MLEGWLLATWIAFAGGGDLVLPPGGTIQALGPGPIVRYVADRDGAVTFALDSFEMDAFLCVTDEVGMLIAAADDGGIRQNARVVVDLRADQTVWIECTTMNVNRWNGRFTLSARAGDVPTPTGPQKDAIEGEFYRAYAGRYLVKGDPVRAAEAWVKAAELLLSGGKHESALCAAREAISTARLVGRFDLAVAAANSASVAAQRVGDLHAAIEHAAAAFSLATGRADPRASSVTAHHLASILLASGRLVEARLAFEVGCDLAATDDLAVERALHRIGLAQVARRDESMETAARLLDEADEIARSHADNGLATDIEIERALIAYQRLRFAEADAKLRAVLERAQQRDDASTIGACRTTLGLIRMHWKSDFDAAEREFAAAARAFEVAGEPVNALGARFQRLDLVHRRVLAADSVATSMPADAMQRHASELRALAESARDLDAPWLEASSRLALASWSDLAGLEDDALLEAIAAERVFAESVGSGKGILRARRLQAELRLRTGDVSFATEVLDQALAEFANGEAARDRIDAIGDRVNAEPWSKLAIDLAAARVRSGADAAAEFVRCAPWRDRALWSGGSARSTVVDAQEFVARAWPPTTRFIELVRGQRVLYAFVADEGGIRMIELGPWAELGERADAFVELVRDRTTLAPGLVPEGRALFDALLAPLLGPGTVTHVVVSPGERFAILPFDALLTRDVDAASNFADLPYVIRSMQVDLVTSWRSYVESHSSPMIAAAPRLLVVGDPRPTSLAPLPGARREAHGIAQFAGETFTGSAPVELWTGEDATRARVLGLLANADFVHVAAHAEVDPDDPTRTGVRLANDERLSIDDVASQRLRARLVVLSTCSSADGRARSGSGLLSLANSFLSAGSRGVVSTRFDVDDVSAELFLQRFYRAMWQRDLSPAAALHSAKLEFLDGTAIDGSGWVRGKPAVSVDTPQPTATAHPARWAAYVYSGTEP
ncbi:MAG: CHAT domain-containing protein [Planctomycetes bacterium]|nr:CHAT domain-containing protein [Planctomycetota bacterium]MCC7173382.1 CHAT domain-containing protein [Planctomycetota bacterium]